MAKSKPLKVARLDAAVDEAPDAVSGIAQTLDALGWDENWDRAAASERKGRRETLAVARVTIEQRGRYRLAGPEGETWGQPTGKSRHRSGDGVMLPAVGDWVLVERRRPVNLIHAVLPRRTALMRRAAGRGMRAQIVATNLDTIFVVTSLTLEFNARRVERFVAVAAESGAQPVVLLNKLDACDEPRAYLDELTGLAQSTPLVFTSGLTQFGLDELGDWLKPGHTVALLGASGAGKSTLVNALIGRTVQDTGPVRDLDHRGRHTTRQREMFMMPGGALLIDTPGLRELEAWESGEGLQEAFADIASLAQQCRFRDCQHLDEPDCAVQGAVEAGSLDPFRLDNWQRLMEEAENRDRPWDRYSTVISRERVSSTAFSKRGG